MDALELIQEDHQRILAFFGEYRRLRTLGVRDIDDLEQELIDAVCLDLKILMQVEEEILYPAARRALLGADEAVKAARIEHTGLRYFIAQVEAGTADNPATVTRFLLLAEQFGNHMAEEHRTLFPRLRQSAMDRLALGKALQARRLQLQADLLDETPEAGVIRPTVWERLSSFGAGYSTT